MAAEGDTGTMSPHKIMESTIEAAKANGEGDNAFDTDVDSTDGHEQDEDLKIADTKSEASSNLDFLDDTEAIA